MKGGMAQKAYYFVPQWMNLIASAANVKYLGNCGHFLPAPTAINTFFSINWAHQENYLIQKINITK